MAPTVVRRGWWRFLLPLAAALLFEFTPLDLRLQDRFYTNGRWWVDGAEPVGRAFFYTGPKVALIAVAITLVALVCGPVRWRAALAARGWRLERKYLLLALAGAALVPITVGQLKKTSGVFCPSELLRYGATAPCLRPFSRELCVDNTPRGHCWPAGHASGGFALLALAPLAVSARRRALMVGLALGAGWSMGLYQVFKGAHFLSHTFVTWFIAEIFACIAGAVTAWMAAGSGRRVFGPGNLG